MKKISTHILAVVLGVIIAFGFFRVSSSIADPVSSLFDNPEPKTIVAQNPTINSRSFVAQAVAKTGPAVVRIDTERTVANQLSPFFEDPFFRDFFGNMPQQMPQERQVQGQGSGFIIDRSGIILTNAHVVDQADKVTVTLQDGREFPGEVLGTDRVTDLAVVKIAESVPNLPVASLGDSAQVVVGDWAIAVGSPGGLNNTVTLGIISTLDRSSAKVGIPDKRVNFLQTDAAINPGNSGGPLLNERGEVIGINTAIRANAMGIGFAIPINKAKDLKDTLAAGREVPHPFVGIQMVDLTPEAAKRNNNNPNSTISLPEVNGVLVMQVLPNTPAERGGIRRGDVITEIDGKPIKTSEEVQRFVENSGVGKNLQFKVLRGDRTTTVTIRTEQMRDNV
ncbi:MAG: HhoA/HhoB/HtrA family serine endopeptidase [Jaaginema sp. PMC 1080.18]|nr:HhoA/HhoB/HtrA family serine endopeptidase [Jaaginema sp. PMC 1080.18]MEC4867661.1 HhoA/HhoB/HtrA family serine endopeptidase [Jaaginema sp. PMC 1078.18]